MRCGLLFLGLALLTTLATAAEPSPSVQPVPGDVQDLVLFLKSQPHLIRLHLQIDGRSFQSNWEEIISQLFRYLDLDGDGKLDQKEAALAPSKTQWVQLMTGASVEPDAAPDFAELANSPTAKAINLSTFRQYYRRSGGGALQVEWGWRTPSPDHLSDALFQYLDKDKDGCLSRPELDAAETVLRPLDTDGDELIHANELNPRGGYPPFTFRSTSEGEPAPKNFPLVIVPPDTQSEMLVRELLGRYDRNKDQALSRDELLLEKAAFDALDSNNDGKLDRQELARWHERAPGLELMIPLELGQRKDILLKLNPDGRRQSLQAMLSPPEDRTLRIPLANNQLEVVRESGRKVRRELLQQFQAAAGKEGFLTEKQIYQPPFPYVAFLRLADRNGDNRLSVKEMEAFFGVQDKFLFRTTHLSVIDRGESLFEFLDADHDGRLSLRELRTAWKRLSVWDRDHNNHITRAQVPRQFQLVLSYGQPRISNLGQGFAEIPLMRDRSRGPLWFRKMDRNGDGDISRAEFLGTRSQFDQIDRDGDGLIDLEEAERADAGLRKR